MQVIRSDDGDGPEESWVQTRPDEVPLGTPLCDVATRLELLRDQLHLGGQVYKHSTTGWFTESVTHPSPEEFPEQSYALTVAVFEPPDLSELRQHDMQIGRASCRERVCQYV